MQHSSRSTVMSAKLVRRSCPIDVLRHVFKRRRVENYRSHSTEGAWVYTGSQAVRIRKARSSTQK